MSEFNIDDYTKAVDDLIKKEDIKLLIELPEGKLDAEVRGSFNIPALDIYIMMHGLKTVLDQLFADGDVMDPKKKGDFLDGIFDMIRGEILEGDADASDK